MADPLETVLGLVADGRLTAEQAAPLIDALQESSAEGRQGAPSADPAESTTTMSNTPQGRPTALRIEVSESGRKVVNLRIPLNLGGMALDHVPGLSTDNILRIREALEHGMSGSLLVVDEGDGGDGVRISLE